jgi:hypothetical protein
MPIQIEEIRAAALANESHSGNLGGQLAEFYKTGGGDPNNPLMGLETKWLNLMGYADPSLSEQWAAYLTNFGFTGDLFTNVKTEADARNLFPQPGSLTVFALLIESGDFLLTEDGFHLLNN